MIKQLFYKWFNIEDLPCKSCETLQHQLEIANYEKKELLNRILSFTEPKVEEQIVNNIEPIRPKAVSWKVRQQELEREDRHKAKLLKEKEAEMKALKDLEKEVGIRDEQSG